MFALLNLPRRWFNLGGFAVCMALLGYAYYSQFHDGLDPCPLCIFQRVGIIAIGLIFLFQACIIQAGWAAEFMAHSWVSRRSAAAPSPHVMSGSRIYRRTKCRNADRVLITC